MKNEVVVVIILTIILSSVSNSGGIVEALEMGEPQDLSLLEERMPQTEVTPENDPVNELDFRNEWPSRTVESDNLTRETRSVGEPDDFGYLWDDTEIYEWIDAKTLGVDLGINGSLLTSLESIPLGFTFPFYENNYSDIYVATSGMVNFDMRGSWPITKLIPSEAIPNNFIAPFWADLAIYNAGNRPKSGIYFLTGGIEPERFAVIEWYRADVYSGQVDVGYEVVDLTFEVIIHENGDIVFQYKNMPSEQLDFFTSAEVGIENSYGMIGSYYPSNSDIREGLAIRFNFPPPSQRLYFTSVMAGDFAIAGEKREYIVHMENSGDLGEDTFELIADSVWPMTIFERAGMEEVTDPISLSQGQMKDLIVRISIPEDVESGDMNIATLTAISLINSAITKSIKWTLAVPAPFVQIYSESVNHYQPTALFVKPNQQLKSISEFTDSASNLAVETLPNGNFVFFSGVYAYLDPGNNIYGYEIYYWILDRNGGIVLTPTLLSEIENPTESTFDLSVAVDVNSNGDIGVIWVREKQKLENDSDLHNTNIQYLVLKQDGSVKVPRVNLTSDSNWYGYGEIDTIEYGNPKIAAANDGNFTLGWSRREYTQVYLLGYLEDIYLTVVDETGNVLMNPTRATESRKVFGYTLIYIDLTLTSVESVNGNQIFITWSEAMVGLEDFYLKIISQQLQNSIRWTDGTVAIAPAILESYSAMYSDVAQLSNGKIMLVADSYDSLEVVIYDINTEIHQRDLHSILIPREFYGEKYISVTHDQEGRGIITWDYENDGSTNSKNLGYMLINSDGDVLSNPMFYFQAEENEYGNIFVSSSKTGNGVATYLYSAPDFVNEPEESAYTDFLYSYTIIIDDAYMPEDRLTITAPLLPSWLSLTDNGDGTALLSGIPNIGDVGLHSIEIEVRDDWGVIATQSFTVSVSVSEVPNITSENITWFAEGIAGAFMVESSGVPVPNLSVSGELPNGISFLDNGDGTGTISGVLESGVVGTNYPITLIASNGVAPDANQSFTLSIGGVPQFTSGDSVHNMVVEGVYAEITETADGTPAPEISISGSLPDGMSFTPSAGGTGLVSGIPAAGSVGVYTVVLNADNGLGEPDTLEFVLTVAEEREIGNEGGVLNFDGGKLVISVAPDVLSAESAFVYIPQNAPTEEVPLNFTLVGPSFQIVTKNMSGNVINPHFEPPFEVQVHYDESNLGELEEDELILQYWDTVTSSWLDAGDTCTNGNGYIYNPDLDYFTVKVCHLTEFAVMGKQGVETFIPLLLY